MIQVNMTNIDEIAKQFYITKDKIYSDKFMVYISPIVKKFAVQKCVGSKWDSDELYSILLFDMWRLLNVWVPEEGKKFHWLMLKQLKNKTINFIHKCEGRAHKVCPTCGTRQVTSKTFCECCKISLKLPDRVMEGIFDYGDHNNYLEELANKDLIDKLLKELETDPKTLKIIQLLLLEYTKGEISQEIGIAQNAVTNRILKCQKIVNKLIK